MDKIAFKSHKTRGQEIIRILENMGGVNKYNLDGSQGTVLAIETNYGNYITNDWDILGLMKLGYKIYTLEEYEEELCEKSPLSPTTGLVEEENKPKFKVGDKIISNVLQLKWKVIDVERTGYKLLSLDSDLICDLDGKNEHYYELMEEEMKSEDELLNEYEELTDRAFKGGYEKCKSDIELNGFQLPDGYIFKDQRGNEIHTTKIVLEKANTLKIQSNNMETETHRGYYTTEEETTNESKKVAWFTFGDNDFADKVAIDLSDRELIQEDGKWFVVKKKLKYPKTYEECLKILGFTTVYTPKVDPIFDYDDDIITLQKLKNCRDAYWKIAGEEMGLGKPWEPDYDNEIQLKYGLYEILKYSLINPSQFVFPTGEMRDAFYENFKEEIEKM